MTSSVQKGTLYLVIASVCWSFGGLCIKFIPWGAMSIVGLRALLAFTLFAVWRRSLRINLTTGNVLAGSCLSVTTILFVFANKLTTAAAAILLQFTAPIFIILILFAFYGKRPTLVEVVAVVVTIAGMLLFFADRLEGGELFGNLLAIGSGVAFAGVFVCNKRTDTNPEQSIQLGFLINSCIGLPFAFFEVTCDPVAWGSVVFLGIVQVGIAYICFSIGIKRTPALLACLITAFEPVLNPVWVALAIGETPSTNAMVGGATILLTVIAYNIRVNKHPQR